MRRAVVGLLAASSLAGCNLLFGLDETTALPDAPAMDAPWMVIHLGFLQLPPATNDTPEAPVEIPFPDLVKVEASTLDGTTTTPLTAVDGQLLIPAQITAGSWRLIYQRQDEPPHELQNLPADAHVIEPLYGPLERIAPTAGMGYTITPTSYQGDHGNNRVFTTGMWTEGTRTLAPAGATLNYDLPDAVSYDGPLGTPGSKDRGVLVDFLVLDGCRAATGSVDFPASPVGPPKPAVSGPWLRNAATPTITTPINLIATTDIAPLGEGQGPLREQYGYLPSKEMPELTRRPDPGRTVLLRNPPLLTLRTCPLPYPGAVPMVAEPTYFKDHLVRAVHTEITATRPLAAGPTLVNGLAIVTTDRAGVLTVATDVAFPRNVKLLTGENSVLDLFGASDRIPLPAGASTMTLSWDKLSPGSTAHFWEVALIEVQSLGLTTRRIYVTTSTSLAIQRSDLAPGKEYVLALTAFSGRNGAMVGDFRIVSPDQAISVTHTRTFVTP